MLILSATVFFIPHLSAETAGLDLTGQEFNAAIPKEKPGGPGSREELAKGKFLVASRRLQDPTFRETVVLLIEYGLDGAMGVVINRPSAVKLTTVFPDIEELKQRKDTIYVGGPVDNVLMRGIDMILAFPYILLALGIVCGAGVAGRSADDVDAEQHRAAARRVRLRIRAHERARQVRTDREA